VGNRIFGRDFPNSRLATCIRQPDGLSHLETDVREELDRALQTGFTPIEIAAAKSASWKHGKSPAFPMADWPPTWLSIFTSVEPSPGIRSSNSASPPPPPPPSKSHSAASSTAPTSSPSRPATSPIVANCLKVQIVGSVCSIRPTTASTSGNRCNATFDSVNCDCLVSFALS
jgi:hypothetical protein